MAQPEQLVIKPDLNSPNNQTHTPTFDIDQIWKSIDAQLQMYISKRNYKVWFKDFYLSKIDDNGIAEFSTNNSQAKEWIEDNHRALIKKILLEITGRKLEVLFTIRSGIQREVTETQTEVRSKHKYEYYDPNQGGEVDIFSSNQIQTESGKEKRIRDAQLNPKYTFETFVVGSHSRLAHAVAEAIVDGVGTVYNPVFFYGSTGVGKTHLMQAIGNAVIEKHPDKKVVYTSTEQFLNEMIEAIRTKNNIDFRKKYREVDLLIIDDIQFIETMAHTQEEVFNTFNTLYQANKQIILASDRPPNEIKSLSDRLRSRFSGGMVADIQIPQYETRMAILKQLVNTNSVNIENNVLDLIAKNIESNVRELEGAVTKVISITRLGQIPDQEMIAKMLQFDLESKRRRIKPERIIEVVCAEFDVTKKEIKGKRRTAYIALARQVVMYLLREVLGLPLEKVAREVNRTDHTTVLHACEKIEKKIGDEERFNEKIEKCKQELNNY
jgi:chromosomal replication initiator protein